MKSFINYGRLSLIRKLWFYCPFSGTKKYKKNMESGKKGVFILLLYPPLTMWSNFYNLYLCCIYRRRTHFSVDDVEKFLVFLYFVYIMYKEYWYKNIILDGIVFILIYDNIFLNFEQEMEFLLTSYFVLENVDKIKK